MVMDRGGVEVVVVLGVDVDVDVADPGDMHCA